MKQPKTTNEAGFAHYLLLLLIGVVVIVAVISIALRVKNANPPAQSNSLPASKVDNVDPFYAAGLKAYNDCLQTAVGLELGTSVCKTQDGSSIYPPLPDPRGKTQTFVFKPWGVQATYEGSQKLSFTISDNQYAWFNDDKLLGLDGGCHNAVGTIIRLAPTDNIGEGQGYGTTADPFWQAQNNLPKGPKSDYAYINDYYYIYKSPQAGCSDKASAIQQQMLDQDTVQSLIPKLKASK